MQQNPKSILPSLLRFADRCFLAALMLMMLSLAATAHTASVYVPVDSWVYPAAERLAALTGAQAEVTGMRPWTRSQFAHFLERAREMQHDAEASGLQDSLEREFAPELNSEIEREALESTYVRTTQIAGTPLRDSYHFGQTFVNDFGRPYGQGFNAISGSSGYVQQRAGMLYVRGEYQHGASLARPPASAIDFLTEHDEVTSNQVLTQGGPAVDNPRLLDAYIGASFGHWTATLGKQSLWWGPATGGAFLESNNAEPIWMGRLTNDLPYKIPLLGKARLDMFYGKLQGHTYLAQPWIHGEKIAFQPFKDFEIGFTRTVVFLGVGRGATFGRIWHSYVSIDDGPPGNSSADTAANDPGDRRSGLDFSWKLPKIPVTLYSDGFSDDEPSPLASPTRSSFHPGIYVAQLPGPLAKVDLRVEGSYTVSENPSISNGFNYWNSSYRDGYTNKGLLIGDPVGRAGVQWQVWSTYWLSPRNKIQVSFRDHYISPQFVQGGGTQSTFRTSSNFQLRRKLDLELGVQSERVVIPLLTGSLAPKYNMSGWVGVKYSPEHKVQ
jgi:hypothetical protein